MASPIEQADHEEIVRAAAECRHVDPEVSKRVRERAAAVRETIRQNHGVVNLAVRLIRAACDG
jgi:hypothetical protein